MGAQLLPPLVTPPQAEVKAFNSLLQYCCSQEARAGEQAGTRDRLALPQCSCEPLRGPALWGSLPGKDVREVASPSPGQERHELTVAPDVAGPRAHRFFTSIFLSLVFHT